MPIKPANGLTADGMCGTLPSAAVALYRKLPDRSVMFATNTNASTLLWRFCKEHIF
jgi:hypothetical protein